MQISKFRYADMDFFKTPRIQIWFLGKDLVFKYEFLVPSIYPCLHFHSVVNILPVRPSLVFPKHTIWPIRHFSKLSGNLFQIVILHSLRCMVENFGDKILSQTFLYNSVIGHDFKFQMSSLCLVFAVEPVAVNSLWNAEELSLAKIGGTPGGVLVRVQ